MMTKTPTKYPMIRTEMRQFPLDNGATSKEINNPFNGKVPQRVIIGILKTTSFNDQYKEDPLAFGKFGVDLRFPMWPMEDTMTRFFYLKMKASSTFTLNVQGKQVRKR